MNVSNNIWTKEVVDGTEDIWRLYEVLSIDYLTTEGISTPYSFTTIVASSSERGSHYKVEQPPRSEDHFQDR